MSSVHSLKPNPQRKRRVLVVDDNLDAVHSMAMLIKMYGHEVQFAINAFAAIDIARSFRPDVILLDVNMPCFGGDDVARQIKWEPGLENTRMIAITGNPDDEVRARVLKAGCEALFAKPVAPALLEDLLAKTA
jgi:CheY-like chemotaxis protein